MRLILIPTLLIPLMITACSGGDDYTTAFSIPRVNGISLDGDLGDWEGKGVDFPLLVSTEGKVDLADYHADVKVGWDDYGLWIACKVVDDELELRNRRILQNDALELFVSGRIGKRSMVQYVTKSGPEAFGENRQIQKNGPAAGGPIPQAEEFRMTSTDHPDGYSFEIFIAMDSLLLYGPDP